MLKNSKIMASNSFKRKQAKQKRRSSLFAFLDKKLGVDLVFEKGVPVQFFPYILFVAIIMLFYIGNSHYGEKNIRRIDMLQREVEDLRTDYTTLKADYMYASKQSEVAKSVEVLGLQESSKPPFKIMIDKQK